MTVSEMLLLNKHQIKFYLNRENSKYMLIFDFWDTLYNLELHIIKVSCLNYWYDNDLNHSYFFHGIVLSFLTQALLYHIAFV